MPDPRPKNAVPNVFRAQLPGMKMMNGMMMMQPFGGMMSMPPPLQGVPPMPHGMVPMPIAQPGGLAPVEESRHE